MIKKIEKYGAKWCMPCKVLDKTLSNISNTVEIIKYDIEDNPELSESKGIRNIPVLIFYNKDNTEVTRTVGAISLEEILKIIES